MEKPSAAIGIVENETLLYERQGQQVLAIVGTLSWYAWLETATTFTFASEEGTFTAHAASAGFSGARSSNGPRRMGRGACVFQLHAEHARAEQK